MKQIKQPLDTIKTWYLKLLKNLFYGIALLVAAIVALLHLPPVQKKLVTTLCNHLRETTHYKIKCDAIRLTWLCHITLKGLDITDPQDKPLLSIDLCKGKLDLLDLCLLGPHIISSFSVLGAALHLEKNIEKEFNIATFYTKVILPFIPETNTGLSIDKVELTGVNVCYHNQVTQEAISLKGMALSISQFRASSDQYSGNLTRFFYEDTDDIPLGLQNFITEFTVTPDNITLKNCHLVTKYSDLQGDFTLKNSKQLPVFSNQEDMQLEAILHKTALSSIDLSKFSDFFKESDILYKLDGIVFLSRHAVKWSNCKLVFGPSDSFIESTGCYNGLNANLLVKKGKVYINDLPKKLPLYLNPCQYIGVTNVTFVGNTQKAKLNGHIETHIGAIQTALSLHDLGKATQDVTGNLTLHKIAINNILPTLPIQSLSGKVDLKAQGDHLNALKVMAYLTEIKTNAYSYKDVEASCIVANAVANFKLHSKDPSANLALVGSYHMALQKSLKMHGVLKQVRLEKVGLVTTPLSLGTHFSLEIKNILDKNPQGNLLLNRFALESLNKKVICNQLEIDVIEKEDNNLLALTSPLIDCRLKGIFTIKDLIYHIKSLIKKFDNPLVESTMPPLLYLDYAINCKNVSPILNWFSNDWYLSSSTTFSGHFSYDRDYHFSLDIPIASKLCFKKCNLENIKVKLNISHLMDSKKRLINLSVASDKQDWQELFKTDHLSFQLVINKNRFTFSNKLSNQDNHLSIASSGILMHNGIQIHLLPSRLITKKKVWTIQTKRTSFISKAVMAIGDLSIESGRSSIHISGQLAESRIKDPLRCNINHIALDYASPVGLLKGILDTKLVAYRKQGQIITTGSLSVKETTIQDYDIGTFSTKVDWNLLQNKLLLEGMLQKADQEVLQINGSYHLTKPSDNLSITTIFNQMDLALLNPFFASVCSDITGKLSGKFQLRGSLNAPKVNGKGTIDKGKLTINYLNTSYQAHGKIKVQDNYLYVKQLHLQDGKSGYANLSGYIAMQHGCPLMLSGSMNGFHLLDTTRMDNPDFYGDLYASGPLQMEGSIYNLLLKMQITADRGSCTIIAHDKENIDNTTKLVQFVYNQPKKELDSLSKDEDDSVIKLMLDLVILPAIKTQVVFGSSYSNTNDVLQGQGTGTIQLEIGTNRKPYVMGNYLFQSGTYRVSVYNLIQKTFTIAPNSQVNFNGYPQEGLVHIEASYKQTASIAELYPQSNDTRPIPVEIALSACGRLAHPHVAYQLFFPVKSMDFELNTALEECASKALLDKHYLNKQILSLLVAKRLYNEKAIDGSDALRNSINDLLSQRIQNLVSKLNDNLEIEADLGINKSKNEQENIFQKTKITVSYLLLSERLKLSSTLGKYSHFINDWEIAYRMTKAYNMHAKLYQQPIQSRDANQALFGISFAYTKKFY